MTKLNESSWLNKFIIIGLKASLTGLFMFPILPYSASGFCVLLFAVFAFVHFLISPKAKVNKLNTFILFLFAAIPLVYASELLFANDMGYVWSVAQRKMGLLFIPLGFYLLSFSHSQLSINLKDYLKIFMLSIVGLMCYTISYILIFGLNQHYIEGGGFAYGFRTFVEEISGLHPTYFGMMICFAILYFINLTLKSAQISSRLFFCLLSIIMIGFLMLLASRIVLLALFVGLIIIGVSYLKSIRAKLIFLVSISSLLAVSVITLPSIRERVEEMFVDEVNSTNVRNVIYSCSAELIEENWLTGCSIENTQKMLNQCYEENGRTLFEQNYNSHNEYFNLILTKGIFLLMIFLALLVVLFIRARGNMEFILFLCIFTIVCLTENLLERQMGVFFFSIFGTYFAFSEHKLMKKESITHK